MAQKMELSNLIWFVGNHKNPQKWISNFDLLVYVSPSPSLKDINNLLLAARNNLSIIVSQNAGLEEFVINNQTGLLVDINKSEELAKAIIDLEQNHVKRKRFGENGRKLATEKFQLKHTIDGLKEVFSQ
jgi:glycosyltransferase involved in cell wall biosynthesis